MLTVSASSMQLILRTERDLQGPWVHEGEGKLSPPLSQVLPVGKPSAMWVSSSGPDMLPNDSASCPKTASRPPDRTGRGSKISKWGEEGSTPSASASLPVVLLMLPSEGPGAGATLWGERVLPADLGTACCPDGTNLPLDLRSNVCCFVSSVK